MRGYFGFGAEGISKPMNMGNLVRSAHAFGAQFVFTVSAHYSVREGKSDTSKAPNHLPWYDWDSCEEMVKRILEEKSESSKDWKGRLGL